MREEAERKIRDDNTRRFVTGPTLTLPLKHTTLDFSNDVVVLPGIGDVYSSVKMHDDWGFLESESGALVSLGWRWARVPAPKTSPGGGITGEGWILNLAKGWRLISGKRPGDYTVTENPHARAAGQEHASKLSD